MGSLRASGGPFVTDANWEAPVQLVIGKRFLGCTAERGNAEQCISSRELSDDETDGAVVGFFTRTDRLLSRWGAGRT